MWKDSFILKIVSSFFLELHIYANLIPLMYILNVGPFWRENLHYLHSMFSTAGLLLNQTDESIADQLGHSFLLMIIPLIVRHLGQYIEMCYELPTEAGPLTELQSSDESSLPLMRTHGNSNGCPCKIIFNDLVSAGDHPLMTDLIKS